MYKVAAGPSNVQAYAHNALSSPATVNCGSTPNERHDIGFSGKNQTQKGGETMFRYIVRYTRYALSTLSAVGFGLYMN